MPSTVSAREKNSGVEASVVVKPSYGLSDGEIADMLKEQQMEAAKQLEKEKSEKSAMQKELEFYRAKAAAEAEEYKKQQEPKQRKKQKNYLKELMSREKDCRWE